MATRSKEMAYLKLMSGDTYTDRLNKRTPLEEITTESSIVTHFN